MVHRQHQEKVFLKGDVEKKMEVEMEKKKALHIYGGKDNSGIFTMFFQNDTT
jgi:hypothetical protein